MTITITIEDEHVPSLEQYLRTQQTSEVDPITKAIVVKPIYPGGVPEFIESHVGNLIHHVVQQYPTAAMREKLAQIKALQDEMEKLVRPKVQQGV